MPGGAYAQRQCRHLPARGDHTQGGGANQRPPSRVAVPRHRARLNKAEASFVSFATMQLQHQDITAVDVTSHTICFVLVDPAHLSSRLGGA